MKQCKGCQRLKRNKECAVFKPKPDPCWAYTADPRWAEKVREAVEKYRFMHGEQGDDEDDET